MNKCPNCERENRVGDKICVYCGTPLTLEGASTRALEDTDYEEGRPQWGTARFNSRMRLIINERDSKDQHVFYLDESDELMLGRLDPDTGEAPDIDLSPYRAAEKGVSRRHAMIARRETALNIIDLGTPNGTFLNGMRLVANQPRVLRDGDEVRLGHLVLRISFGRV
ncbi:MAG: FHA domain-containing protein [Anaerolineae bacterium]|nr:FHA domain-containing protein [Anaerolineae bacterium]